MNVLGYRMFGGDVDADVPRRASRLGSSEPNRRLEFGVLRRKMTSPNPSCWSSSCSFKYDSVIQPGSSTYFYLYSPVIWSYQVVHWRCAVSAPHAQSPGARKESVCRTAIGYNAVISTT